MNKRSAIIVSFMLGLLSTHVFAAGGMVKGPNVIAPDRYVYYPGTEVLDKVLGFDEHAQPTTRTVDTHIAKLRKKIEEDPSNPEHLITVHRLGYKFVG